MIHRSALIVSIDTLSVRCLEATENSREDSLRYFQEKKTIAREFYNTDQSDLLTLIAIQFVE